MNRRFLTASILAAAFVLLVAIVLTGGKASAKIHGCGACGTPTAVPVTQVATEPPTTPPTVPATMPPTVAPTTPATVPPTQPPATSTQPTAETTITEIDINGCPSPGHGDLVVSNVKQGQQVSLVVAYHLLGGGDTWTLTGQGVRIYLGSINTFTVDTVTGVPSNADALRIQVDAAHTTMGIQGTDVTSATFAPCNASTPTQAPTTPATVTPTPCPPTPSVTVQPTNTPTTPATVPPVTSTVSPTPGKTATVPATSTSTVSPMTNTPVTTTPTPQTTASPTKSAKKIVLPAPKPTNTQTPTQSANTVTPRATVSTLPVTGAGDNSHGSLIWLLVGLASTLLGGAGYITRRGRNAS